MDHGPKLRRGRLGSTRVPWCIYDEDAKYVTAGGSCGDDEIEGNDTASKPRNRDALAVEVVPDSGDNSPLGGAGRAA